MKRTCQEGEKRLQNVTVYTKWTVTDMNKFENFETPS